MKQSVPDPGAVVLAGATGYIGRLVERVRRGEPLLVFGDDRRYADRRERTRTLGAHRPFDRFELSRGLTAKKNRDA